MTRTACAFEWEDDTAPDHRCHLLPGHPGLHECGEDDECDATQDDNEATA